HPQCPDASHEGRGRRSGLRVRARRARRARRPGRPPRGAPRAPVLPADRPRARGRARPAARRVAALARRAAAGGGIAVWSFDRRNWSHWLLLVFVVAFLLSYFGFVSSGLLGDAVES